MIWLRKVIETIAPKSLLKRSEYNESGLERTDAQIKSNIFSESKSMKYLSPKRTYTVFKFDEKVWP